MSYINLRNTFDEQYHCYSASFVNKDYIENGDKIILPSSAFEELARMNIEYPMLFEIRSENYITHCGVLEFSAPEGYCYLPFWMMQNLFVNEGDLISIKNVSLPKATFVKLKPQSLDFLDISNPRAVLEKQLRMFSCVTVNDHICMPYNNKKYYLEIKEVKPKDAACIIECDCNVDFEEPIGYKENFNKSLIPKVSIPSPKKALSEKRQQEMKIKESENDPFITNGYRLDGKNILNNNSVINAKIEQEEKIIFKKSKKNWSKLNKSAFLGKGNSLK